MEYSVILYHSTQYAIWTGKLLKQSGLYYKMIPVPRHLSSDCGYCVRIKSENKGEVELILKSAGIEYHGIEAI